MEPRADAPVRRSAAAAAPRLVRAATLALLLVLGGARTPAAEAPSKEHQLKAAFLYNFLRYTEWPAARLPQPASPIVVGVVGADALASELETAVRGRKIEGRSVVVRVLSSLEQACDVHLLFVPAAQTERTLPRLEQLHAAHVLTVGETPAFGAAAGIIVFTAEDDKVRFAVNLRSAQEARVRLSSQLIKLAIAVKQ